MPASKEKEKFFSDDGDRAKLTELSDKGDRAKICDKGDRAKTTKAFINPFLKVIFDKCGYSPDSAVGSTSKSLANCFRTASMSLE